MEPTTTVGSATTMKSATTMEPANCAASAGETMPAFESTAFIAAADIPMSAVEPATIISVSPAPAAVIPRAGADEDSIREPAWTVVSIRSARIRIIGIVSILTNRSRPHIPRSNPDADAHSHLCLRGLSKRQWNQQNRQHRQISQVLHNDPLVRNPCLQNAQSARIPRPSSLSFLSERLLI